MNDKRERYLEVLSGYKHTKKPKKVKHPEFRVWDGEGKTNNDTNEHYYVLLSNSDEEYVYNENGLSTVECLKFLLQPRKRKKEVWFSFGYDICKILKDIPLRKSGPLDYSNLETLWDKGKIDWRGFRIHYIPRKIFSVSLSRKHSFYSADTFTFFQKSFLASCADWGIDASAIEQGKNDRSRFDTYSFEELLSYNFLELRYMKQLVTKLYEAFYSANLVPHRWHGPGAVAGTFFKESKLQHHWGKETALPEMEIPIRHAYFGGRIDIAYVGELECHHYDITSAYPHAITDLISLENVFWHHNYAYVNDKHALYHVSWDISRNTLWGPFPWRKANGTVLFPLSGEGWYWGVEVLAAERLFGQRCIKRISAYYPMCIKKYPFAEYIVEKFNERKKVGKKTGPGVAIKIILNSLYGKLCQSIGGKEWQNYIWAGYITAYTRATMLDAIGKVGSNNVVAINTDGIYTKKRLRKEATFGTLGSWEYEGKLNLLLVGAGLYTEISKAEINVVKSRGMAKNLNHGFVLREWGCNTGYQGKGEDSTISHFTTFVTIGKAIYQNKPFGIFIQDEKQIENVPMGGTSKRLPVIDLFFEKGWKELPLAIRQRPHNSPMLSAPFMKNFEIINELRVICEEAEH